MKQQKSRKRAAVLWMAGKEYLNGGCSLEEAVEEIQKKMEIYMAE